jgi:hypothetical protein
MHGVEVEAETLYEAAGMGLARLKKDGWMEGLGPGSRLEIQVREPSTLHSLTVQQLHRGAIALPPVQPKCCDGRASSTCWGVEPGTARSVVG